MRDRVEKHGLFFGRHVEAGVIWVVGDNSYARAFSERFALENDLASDDAANSDAHLRRILRRVRSYEPHQIKGAIARLPVDALRDANARVANSLVLRGFEVTDHVIIAIAIEVLIIALIPGLVARVDRGRGLRVSAYAASPLSNEDTIFV